MLCSSQEFEEEEEEEWKTFVPAPRYTEADELIDVKSLQCKLQETLVLLVNKEKDSPSGEPPLAEVILDTNETLQQVYEGDLLIQITIHVLELVHAWEGIGTRRHIFSYFSDCFQGFMSNLWHRIACSISKQCTHCCDEEL